LINSPLKNLTLVLQCMRLIEKEKESEKSLVIGGERERERETEREYKKLIVIREVFKKVASEGLNVPFMFHA
jgi:hypothetical protein